MGKGKASDIAQTKASAYTEAKFVTPPGDEADVRPGDGAASDLDVSDGAKDEADAECRAKKL